MAVATGNTVLLGLAPELEYGVPDDKTAALEYLKPILPVTVGLNRAVSPGGEVNQSGFAEPGVPGPIAGTFDIGCRMSSATLLTYFEHLFGDCKKTELEAKKAYKYEFEPKVDGVDTSFGGVFALPPVDQHRIYGVKLSQISMQIGNNTAIPVRLTGFVSHGTRVGKAKAAAGNTGTYKYLPVVRGLVDPSIAATKSIFVKVTTASGGAFKFKVAVENSSGTPAPTFSGAEIVFATDPVTGRGVWQNLTDAAGADLGIWAENRDPLEIIWPGTATEFAGLAVGDIYEFPLAWTLPTATYLTGQRYTSAHQINKVRPITDPASDWAEFRTMSATITIPWPLTVDQGSGSRYVYGLERDGLFAPTLQLTRKHTDRDFVAFLEQHAQFEMETHFIGGQLTDASKTRERIVFKWGRVSVANLARPAQNDLAITETITLAGETDDAGTAPLKVEVYSDRGEHWTPVTPQSP
jgi:hypothetical protein